MIQVADRQRRQPPNRSTQKMPQPRRPEPQHKGPLLSVDMVRDLFPADNRPSRWYVLKKFAPQHRKKVGKYVYWWEADALRFIDEECGA